MRRPSRRLPAAPDGQIRPAQEGRTPVPPKKNVDLLRRLEKRHAEFLEYATGVLQVSGTTQIWYRDSFRNFYRFLADGSHLAPARFQERVSALDEWIEWNHARGISRITMNSYWRAVRAFFNDCERRDGALNAFRLHAAPALPDRLPKALPEEKCSRILLAAANYPWKNSFARARALALIATILYTGLRRSELLNLYVMDVNLDEGTIFVRAGKGEGGGKQRVAYIPPDLAHILQEYLRERLTARFVSPEFFSSQATGQGMSLSTLRRIFAKVERAAGFPFSPHVLRHSYVSQMLKSGVPIHIAKDLAGHNDIATTLEYLKVFDGEMKKQAEKIRYRL
jgi:site-specific recombinase XerD